MPIWSSHCPPPGCPEVQKVAGALDSGRQNKVGVEWKYHSGRRNSNPCQPGDLGLSVPQSPDVPFGMRMLVPWD